MAPTTAAGRRAGQRAQRGRHRCGCPPRIRSRGFGVLWALLCVALMGIYLMQAGQMWSTLAQRAKEDELLRRGDAIRRAIESYVKADTSGTYPKSFEELISDPRVSFARRHLRAAYDDPVTNGPWQVIRGPAGEMYGVYSASTDAPLKRDEFPDQYASFALQTSYAEWKFTFFPSTGLMRR